MAGRLLFYDASACHVNFTHVCCTEVRMFGMMLWMFVGCIQLLLLPSVRGSIDGIITAVEEAYETDGVLGKSLPNPWDDYKVEGSTGSFVKLQLDMIITKETYESLVDDELPRSRRNAVLGTSKLWPAGRIPYKIDGNFTSKEQVAIMQSMQHWMTHTCVVFEPATKEDFNMITFVAVDDVCESIVGMMQGNQPISLAPNCRTTYVMVHEIGHALGLFHEHMRNDRDWFVTINYENINESLHYNFDKLVKDRYDDYYKPYDYFSIMHYSKFAFSMNRTAKLTTIVPTNETYLDIIGQATEASFLDFQIVNDMYQCSAGCQYKDCPEGSFLGRQCQCYCNVDGRVARCNATGKCKPPDIDPAVYRVYTQEFREHVTDLDRKFPHGTKLLIEFKDRACGDNYTEFSCIQGQWQDDYPTCLEEKSCGISKSWLDEYKVEAVEVVDYDIDENNTTMIEGELYIPSGHQVRLTCKDSPELSNTLTCQSGNWSGEPVRCDMIVNCSNPQIDPAVYDVYWHGSRIQVTDMDTEFQHGSTLDVAFKDRACGYDDTNITCIQGKWQGDHPKCLEEKSCGVSRPWLDEYTVEALGEFNDTDYDANVNNLAMIEDEEYILSRHQIRLSCRVYAELNNVLTCQSGNWSAKPVSCVMKDCKVEYDPEGLYTLFVDGQKQRQGDTLPHGTVMQAFCDHPDYSVGEIVENNMTCYNGEWDDMPPQNCSEGQRDCPQIINATVIGSFMGGFGVTCIDGYALSNPGTSKFFCSYFGEWDPFRPECKPKGCVLSENDSRVTITNSDGVELSSGNVIDHANSVNVTCPHGMYPDFLTVTCKLGHWDTETGQFPQCKEVNCPRPPVTKVLYKPFQRQYVYKDSVTVNKCKRNLEFYGNKVLACQQHGNWSSTAGCRKYCLKGKDSFNDMKNQHIKAKPDRVLRLGRFKPKICMRQCRREKGFLCMAVTYGFHEKQRRYLCNLYRMDPKKKPEIKGYKKFWTLSYRSCNLPAVP